MNQSAIKQLIILVLCCVAALMIGSLLASQSYENLVLLGYLIIAAFVLAAPGFAPLIAFGLLNPFVLPIPFIWGVPFMAVIMGICCVKLFFLKAVRRENTP